MAARQAPERAELKCIPEPEFPDDSALQRSSPQAPAPDTPRAGNERWVMVDPPKLPLPGEGTIAAALLAHEAPHIKLPSHALPSPEANSLERPPLGELSPRSQV